MPRTISSTRGPKKRYYGYVVVPVTPRERMLIEYYARRYGKDRAAVVRGMMHKYIALDQNMDRGDFAEWAEREFIPTLDNDVLLQMCREAVAAVRGRLGEADVAAGTGAPTRP